MAGPATLPVSRLITVNVNLAPLAAQFASFSSLLVVTDNPVFNTAQRIYGPYSQLSDIAGLVGTTDPLYFAAALYFSQVPTPANFYAGRWAATATQGLLECGFLPPSELPMSNWTVITNGGFDVSVDGGAPANIIGLTFASQTNLNGVAAAINTALASHGAGCFWNGSQFIVTSHSSGPASSVSFLTPPIGTGVQDISTMMMGTASTAEQAVPGRAPETAVAAVAILDGISAWYGLMFAATAPVSNNDHLAVAQYIQGSASGATDAPHIYGVTTEDATSLWNPSNATDIASELAAAQYTRTFCIYSSYSAVAAAAVFGIAFSTNWQSSNAAYTLMYKVCFGLTAENLGTAVAGVMDAKRCMYFAAYNNDTSILGFGEMSGPAYFDEIHGIDWLANQVQTNIFNLLFLSRKVPQTDPGEHLFVVVANVALAQGVVNGLIAPGQWNAAGVGAVNQGDPLPTGYYAYIPPVATQSQADREARKSAPMTILVKLAGAVHTVFVQILVER
jgi:hypothetical protein